MDVTRYLLELFGFFLMLFLLSIEFLLVTVEFLRPRFLSFLKINRYHHCYRYRHVCSRRMALVMNNK